MGKAPRFGEHLGVAGEGRPYQGVSDKEHVAMLSEDEAGEARELPFVNDAPVAVKQVGGLYLLWGGKPQVHFARG